MQDLKLPYGLQDDEIVSIDEVEGGLECNCVCPHCKGQLIARKGNINVHHFAHYKVPDCGQGLETVLHKLCKDYFISKTEFITPPLYYPRTSVQIYSEQTIPIDKIEFEQQIDNIRPDIIIESKGKKLLIEIAVNHYVDSFKFNKAKSLGLAMIEIDAKRILANRYFKRDFGLGSQTQLPDEVVMGTSFKRWIFNPKLDKIKRILRENYAELKELKSFPMPEHMGIESDFMYYEDCPANKRTWAGGRNKGKSYAKYTDCNDCIFNVSVDNFSHISCIGYLKTHFYSLIKDIK